MKVYTFAASPIWMEDAQEIHAQLLLGHEHRNKLTEIILEGRKTHRQLVKEHCGFDLEVLEKERDQLLEQIALVKAEINEWKIKEHSRKTEPELAARLRDLHRQLKPIKESLKELKTKARQDPVLQPLLEACDAQVDESIKKARGHFSKDRGLYWPNYLRNEDAANKARFGSFDPRFRRWTGEGVIAIQLQGGLSLAKLFACEDMRLRFIAPAGFEGIDPAKTIRGAAKRIKALWRVSSVSKEPVWIELKVNMHRMLPPEAVIKWAFLKREKAVRAQGRRSLSLLKDYRYTIQLVTEIGDEQVTTVPAKATVAIRTGWTMTPDNHLCVARALGSDGQRFSLLLPNQWLANRLKIQNLSSIIDREVNRVFEELRLALPEIEKPETLSVLPISEEALKILRDQTSQDNAKRIGNALVRVYEIDPLLKLILDTWHTKHLHLLRYKQGVHKRTLLGRLEIYRLFVHRLCKAGYTHFIMPELDLRRVVRTDLTRDKPAQEVIWQRSAAAISTLRSILAEKLELVEDPEALALLEKCERVSAAKKLGGARAA
jgi:hypothetical protein